MVFWIFADEVRRTFRKASQILLTLDSVTARLSSVACSTASASKADPDFWRFEVSLYMVLDTSSSLL